MSKGRILLFVLVLLSQLSPRRADAQRHPDDEYYPYAERERPLPRLETDTTLFYRAVQQSTDLYGKHTDFTLPGVAIRRRGMDYASERTTLSGLELPYSYLGILRQLGAGEQRSAGFRSTEDVLGGYASTTRYCFSAGEPTQPYRVSVRFTDRNYRFGVRLEGSHRVGRLWRLSAAADFRTGRDLHVAGVFTQGVTGGLRFARPSGVAGEFSLMLLLPVSMRGTRLSTSEEAFTLTGDRLYNPAWGFQDGKVRNSRVRRETLPFGLVAWTRSLTPTTRFAATFGARTGTSRYSMLGWYDARTPMPDNYRYLPSYTDDRATEEAWLSNDPRYTQIDWDELILENRMDKYISEGSE